MRYRALLAALCLSTATLASCTAQAELTDADVLARAKADNLNRHVSSAFEPTAQVLADADGSGVDAVNRFFDSSDTLVIAGPRVADQLRAASIAVVAHAPMLTMYSSNRSAVVEEISRLGARVVLAVGEVDLADARGQLTVIKDPGTFVALGEMTAFQFEGTPVASAEGAVAAVAALDPARPSYLYPGWVTGGEPTDDWTSAQGRGHEKAPAFPVQSKRDADMAPVVIASNDSSIASVATARSFGASVRVMPVADPRYSTDTLAMVAGLADSPLIALGQQFGTADGLREKIRLGEATTSELPGGGGVVFPDRTVVGVQVGEEALGDWRAADESRLIEGIDQVLDEAAAQQSAVERILGGRTTSALVVPVDADTPQGLVDALVRETGARGAFLFLQVAPGYQASDLVRQALGSTHVSVSLDSGSLPIASEDVTRWASVLDEVARARSLPQKALVVRQRASGQVSDPQALGFGSPMVQLVIAADGSATATATAAGSAQDAARAVFGEVTSDYTQAGGQTFFGWVSPATPGGGESAGVASADDDGFAQLSPRPWLIIRG
ncbi:hypothetical protein [Corynebacterium vitaeruminis]|uniref:Lipoprotein n=1 Tax=Corynebacterium vitaeruminis DSM 20294 TaxID=1224164 RepID=W5Y078_9CORY|nr:hypothetical protein [Corynebacterium vitaeruminis]AHI22612.1 hypothetical protein B843_06135 [Corynebacterium vitaeruminis DSM 20294]